MISPYVRDAVHFLIYETTRYLSPMIVAIEWVLLALGVIAIALFPRAVFKPATWLHDHFRRIAERRVLACWVCAALPVAIRLAMMPIAPVPYPSIHDEFSHLLLADTLAHGRLTNPTHPMWQHFESIHIIQRPSYNSMYPPAHAMFLALGQVLFHQPWAGVVISVGLSFAAICWMMQGWLPLTWAFYGTLIAGLKIGVVGLWMNTYLGGAVPSIGGALLIGSLPRLRKPNPRWFYAASFALGIIILLNTRPFEGSILSLAAFAYLVPSLWRRWKTKPRTAFRNLLIPATSVFGLGLFCTFFYSYKVTGSPTRMPYIVNRETYGWPENLAILPAKDLTLRHPVMQAMLDRERANRNRYKTPLRVFDSLDTRFFDSWAFFVGPVLSIPLIFLPLVFRDRRTRPLAIFLGIILALNLLQLLLYPQHLAPEVPIIFVLLIQGFRHVYVSLARVSRSRALYTAIVLPVLLVVVGGLKQEALALDIPMSYWERAFEIHRDARQATEMQLSALPGQQLILVRYAPSHSPSEEWVYNKADIDGSKIVWAREMDPVSDDQLLRYFKGRTPWLLEADVFPPHVVPYPVAALEDELKAQTRTGIHPAGGSE